MIEINASKGLGDAIYLRAIVMQLLLQNEQVTVYTSWPQVFVDLAVDVRRLCDIADHSALRHAAYSRVTLADGLSHYAIACRSAGLHKPAPLELRWSVRNGRLLRRIKQRAEGRKIFIYQYVKKANNEEQRLIRPDRKAFREYVESHSDWFRIRTGHPHYLEAGEVPSELDLLAS